MLSLGLRYRHEVGVFYAIDVGGTNIRVMYCQLGCERGKVDVVERDDREVPEAVKKGTSERLFEFIACCFKDFLHKKGR